MKVIRKGDKVSRDITAYQWLDNEMGAFDIFRFNSGLNSVVYDIDCTDSVITFWLNTNGFIFEFTINETDYLLRYDNEFILLSEQEFKQKYEVLK